MVCLGNICRSPLAEGILRSKLPSNFIVDSAGTLDFHRGNKPDKRSIEVAKEHNIDISEQKCRPFLSRDLEEFDKIFCMDQNNFNDVISLAKTNFDRDKVSLILKNNKDVPDPYYGSSADFEEVYQLLDKACTRIARELLMNDLS